MTLFEMAADINRVYAAGVQAGENSLGTDMLKRRVKRLTEALEDIRTSSTDQRAIAIAADALELPK